MRFSFIILPFIVFFYSCNQNKNSSRYHPNEENLPNPDKRNEHIINDLELQQQVNLFQDKNYSLNKIIGNKDESVFGFIKDVEIDENGRIFVLDDRQQKVFIYNKDGELSQIIGGRGRGPSELSYAKSLTIYQDSLLLISNQYRIEEFNIRGDSVSYIRSINLNLNVKSICTTNDALYVHNIDFISSGFLDSDDKKTEMIHKFLIPEYENQFSFGESYFSNSRIVVDRLTQGEIICDPKNEIIVYASDRLNVLHGYSLSNGKQIWKSSIANLNFPLIEEVVVNGNPGLQVIPPKNGIFDKFLITGHFQNDLLFVQVDRRKMVNNETFESDNSVLTYLIDIKTGMGQYYSDSLGRIVSITDSNIIEIGESFIELNIYSKK